MKTACLILALFAQGVRAQALDNTFASRTEVVAEVRLVQPVVRQNRPAMFPGGTEAFNSFVAQTARYPEHALRDGIEGTVYIEAYVMPNGRLQNLEVQGKIGGGCEQEALRVVSLMPRWLPAMHESEPIRRKVRIPIMFTLTTEDAANPAPESGSAHRQ